MCCHYSGAGAVSGRTPVKPGAGEAAWPSPLSCEGATRKNQPRSGRCNPDPRGPAPCLAHRGQRDLLSAPDQGAVLSLCYRTENCNYTREPAGERGTRFSSPTGTAELGLLGPPPLPQPCLAFREGQATSLEPSLPQSWGLGEVSGFPPLPRAETRHFPGKSHTRSQDTDRNCPSEMVARGLGSASPHTTTFAPGGTLSPPSSCPPRGGGAVHPPTTPVPPRLPFK